MTKPNVPRRDDGVFDPREPRTQQEVLQNPRRDAFKDGILLGRRQLRPEPGERKGHGALTSHVSRVADNEPTTLIAYRVIKRTEFVNERMGYGERVSVPLGQAGERRRSQRTRSGVQQLGADKTDEIAHDQKKGGGKG